MPLLRDRFGLMLRLILLAACLGGFACVSPLPTKSPWIEAQTEHFTAISGLDRDETTELLRRLELFRATVQLATNLQRVEERISTRIYIFKDQSAYYNFRPESMVLGYLRPTSRVNIITMLDAREFDSKSIILHEYVHLLLRNNNSLSYPKWFDEGFAEYMSTLKIKDGTVWIGYASEDRAAQFTYTKWIPIKKIVDPVRYERWTPEDKGMFYAEAWLLVHFLMSNPEGVTPFSEGMSRYIGLIEKGESRIEAFEQAYGIDVGDLNRRVRSYARGKVPILGLDQASIEYPQAVRTRSLTEAEVAESLGMLSLSIGRRLDAERLFETALLTRPDFARAHAGLADALAFQGRSDEARAHYERSLALDEEDPLNQLDFAEWRHRVALEKEDPSERHETLREARRHFVKANALKPDDPETLAEYGRTFLAEGEDPSKGLDALARAHELLPSSMRIRFELARIYVASDRPDDAKPLLGSVVAWSHDARAVAAAEALLAEISVSSEIENEDPVDSAE